MKMSKATFTIIEDAIKQLQSIVVLHRDEDHSVDIDMLQINEKAKPLIETVKYQIEKHNPLTIRGCLIITDFNGLKFTVKEGDDTVYYQWHHLVYPGHPLLDKNFPLTKDDIGYGIF